jgi:hypothetical protein
VAEPLNSQTFTGAHPSARDFLDRLLAWGFTRRGEAGPHVVYRAPGGGRVKLLRSLTGRADAELAAKAARYLHITTDQFWAGPPAEPAQLETPQAPEAKSPTPRRRDRDNNHDSAPATVLGIHSKAGRPLAFDEVVTLAGGRLTREQIRSASSTLCRAGNLDRLRPGVYQWSGGAHASRPPQPAITDDLLPLIRAIIPSPSDSRPPTPAGNDGEVELFARLFPDGVKMTAHALADFHRLAELANKLTQQAEAS